MQTLSIPGYALAELVHRGGATVVYRGRREADGAAVIVKAPRSDLPTALDRARLRHEHALLSELAGPGIVAVHPLDLAGNRVALVMEDVGLSSLDRMLDAPLDVGLALRIAAEVASVLGRAHRLRIVHRDVKPHNILVGADPLRVYVIDWGIAARLGDLHRQGEGPPRGEGTLAYISPEQTGTVDRPVGPPSDLYSLGVTLYQMLIGALPFAESSPAALVRAHLLRLPAPPRDLDPRIPEQLSDIVVKLLAKSAEDRYASARGLERDLRECLSQWEARGRIDPFLPGRHDAPSELVVPARLHGREADVAALIEAFERARSGAAELLIISGYPGVGKSAVVREACAPMKLRGARVVTGKFEQFREGAPYASLARALGDLVRQVMTESAGAFFDLRDRVQKALGDNAGALALLVPELDRLLGPQPPAPALGPIETENRFHLAVQRFASVFATAARPLVIFLDDLQWAEPASLKLIERLLTDPERGHMLVIGAHRDHEPGALQLLSRAVSHIDAGGGTTSRITLRPLGPEDVDRLIAGALRTTPPDVRPLGEEIYRRTQGNPFFVGQLLTTWAEEGLITFDADAERWSWDLALIAHSAVTDDVAALMAQKLRRLGPAALDLMKLAACLGGEFGHDTLAQIAGQSTPACARGLGPALAEGLVVALDDDYRLLADLEEGIEGNARGPAGGVSYRFLHDRVQEAAYSLLDEADRPGVHLRAARLLRARYPGAVPEDAVFVIADHLNAAGPLIDDRAERLAAAELDLRAGRRARASAAYDAARRYLAEGSRHLPEDAWETAYDLALALRRAHAESAFLCGDSSEAAALFEDLHARARSPLDRADIYHAQMQLHGFAYRFNECVDLGLSALALLGAAPPETEEGCRTAADAELTALIARLSGRSIEELLEIPRMTDERMLRVMKIALFLDTVAFAAGKTSLSVLMAVRLAALSIDHGPSDLSPRGYASCAQTVLRTRGKSDVTDLMNRLAVALHERYPSPEHSAGLSLALAHAASLERPTAEAIAAYERASEIALKYGDLASYQISTLVGVTVRLLAGDEELESVKARFEAALTAMQRARYDAATAIIRSCLQAIACLQDRTAGPASFDDGRFDQASFLARVRESGWALAEAINWSMRLFVFILHGEHDAAAPLVEEAGRWMRIFGQSMQGHLSFHICLCLVALIERRAGDPAIHAAALEEYHRAIHARRALCDEAWRCQDLIVAAERARLRGEDMDAQRLYDEATSFAQHTGAARLFAIGSELYGRFAVKKGLERLARACLQDAYRGYMQWGAQLKAASLTAELSPYVTPPGRSEHPSMTTSRGTATVALQGILFDLGEAMRTARSISSELAEERVVERFLVASSTYATVTRAFVVLMRDGEPTIAGEWTSGAGLIGAAPRAPISSANVPESVLRFVARSQEAVQLNAADPSDLFAGDPYLRDHRPRSLLCLPLAHQGRLFGMWYAESDVARDLRRGSVELLQLLAGQAASALQNARLVSELEAAGRELSDANQRLRHELDDRFRIEGERAALQERIIAMQEEMLLELSTPLIPISAAVTVLPIIGTLGEARSARMIEAVMSGVHARGAQVLIIDVTGLREVDDAAARVLLKLAAALRLLGVRVVVTGVRAEAARTLVHLDVSMRGIEIRSTLQAGIALAMSLRRREDS